MNVTSPNRPPCDILLAVDAYLPWSGGSRIYYDNLYRRLAEQHGLSIRIETSHCSGDVAFDSRDQSASLNIRRHGKRLADWSWRRAPILAQKMLRLARAGMTASPAAIHCGDLFPQDLAGMFLRKAAGIPFLVFVHGDEIDQTEPRRLQPRIRNQIYRSADAVITANAYAYERAVAICGSARRITTITPGVDCAAFHPGERPEWISRRYDLGDSPVVVTVARLVKKKGHETILRCLPSVLKVIPGLKYLVVGGGPEESRLRDLVSELDLGHCVRFTGDVPHDRLGDFYRVGDVFCMVNQQADGDVESFGMVFIEAGASGKAVIGGLSGGTRESIIEETTGFLCPPGDSKRLGELLMLLLANPGLRYRMGEAALYRARRDFNWDTRAEKLFAIHQAIVMQPRSFSQARQSCPPR